MTAQSDEGMWLLNEPPREHLKAKYGFDLTDDWLEHARLASIRFNNGGSGSFVSPNGLIITNHHIGSDALQKLGSKDRNLLRDGFHAPTLADELKCPDLELNVLLEIIDVTKEVNAAVKPDMKPAEAFAARRAALSAIEKESTDKTGLRSDVVSLYQGSVYHLYRYKKYTDVRLVFAPEQAIASFGGDVDNFEFPRFNLDVSFFRVYEKEKPVPVKHWLKFSETGPADGDLVFVTGHPGTTNRLETYDKLKHRRDVTLPYTLTRLRAMEAISLQYAERGPEQRRQAATALHSYANARKAFSGQYQGLLDPEIMNAKRIREELLIEAIAKKDASAEKQDAATYQKAIKRIADIQKSLASFEKEYSLLEVGHAFSSDLFAIARHIVRMTSETGKPNPARMREYRESNLESLKFQLFSPAPIYTDFERVRLQQSLSFMVEQLGSEHPLVSKVFGTKSPAKLVDELIGGTKLVDPEERRKLVAGGTKTVDDSRDPLIVFARAIDGEARKLRTRYEEEIEEPERQAYSELAGLRFKVQGKSVAPDATFTLRFAFGIVKGYRVDGVDLKYHTTFGEMFDKSDRLGHREPFELPKRWLDGKSKLDLSTPFNFASTADTIGGNSGSPVLNRAGEFVGINFDRNRHGLVRNFVYTEEQARHISVHSKGILEALRKLYDCGALVKELMGKD
ncbi:MAG: S46 family peptidase [Planctomycetes bacterium]|nr:S46 family peptidase [Planctomycetota bacterium]